MGEGHHLYKIKGKYYDVSAIPGGAVNQVVAKATSIDGPWTVTTMVESESLGVPSGAPDPATPMTAACGCTRAAWLIRPPASGGAPSCPTTAMAGG